MTDKNTKMMINKEWVEMDSNKKNKVIYLGYKI